MESKQKLNNSKAVIAYLAEKFPRCFSVTSAVAPLKIGIFQELSACLPDEAPISKTQLRLALRQYTASWRYLSAIKTGIQRIDLKGEPCGELATQHVEYARKKLAAAKLRAQKRHQAQQALDIGSRNAEKNAPQRRHQSKKSTCNQKPLPIHDQQPSNSTSELIPIIPAPTLSIDQTVVKIGQGVQVRLGQKLQSGTIISVNKSSVKVQLASGLALVVRTHHVQF